MFKNGAEMWVPLQRQLPECGPFNPLPGTAILTTSVGGCISGILSYGIFGWDHGSLAQADVLKSHG